MRTPLPDGACRFCGLDAFGSDDIGPRHPCCQFWYEQQGALRCQGCASSQTNGRDRSRRNKGPGRVAGGVSAPASPARPLLARTDDPPSSHHAARAIEPKRDTRKAAVLKVLRDARGQWVDGVALCTPDVGGSEGLRRLRELVNDGWEVRKQPHPRSATAWQYRLVEERDENP